MESDILRKIDVSFLQFLDQAISLWNVRCNGVHDLVYQ